MFNVTNLNAPTIGVFKEAFWGNTEVFVRGGMSGWGTADQFTYNGAGVYSVNIELSAGTVEFKVASEDWSTVNLGNPNDASSNVVSLETGKSIAGSNNNLVLDVPESGLYEIVVTGPDGNNPTLTVFKK